MTETFVPQDPNDPATNPASQPPEPSTAQVASAGTTAAPDPGATPASSVDWVKVVRDNNNSYFVVDFRLGTRHPLLGPGSGQFAAATALYGDPITQRSALPPAWQAAQDRAFPNESSILLDGRIGYRQGLEAVEFYGGPNAMEQVVSGKSPDPFTGELVTNPKDIVAGSGEQFPAQGGQDPTRPAEPEDRSRVDAFQRMRETLRQYDLESLGDWAWSAMQDGRTAAWIQAELPNRPEFKRRFPAIHQMRDKGLTPPSADEYIAYEQQVERLSSSLGLPGEIQSSESVANMLSNNVDPNQIAQFGSLFSRLRRMGLAGGQTFQETTNAAFSDQG